MTSHKAKVSSITPLTPYVFQIKLDLGESISYQAGQYLTLNLSEEDKRPFSIASAPGSQEIELHIGASGEDSWAMQAIEHIKNNESVEVSLPFGEAQLREASPRPIVLLAGGTGFSYINAILERLIQQECKQPIFLYWGVKEQEHAYAHDKLTAMAAMHQGLNYELVLENPDADWQGKSGLVHKAVMQDIVSLEPYDIYVAGRFDMVGKVREEFLQQGALMEHMYGDAFAFIK